MHQIKLYFLFSIDLHTRAEESVDRTYEPDDIARYISFARLFKPKVTEESMDFLVEQYRHLRQRDTGGGFKSSWRITVRQLESMIRLSEAMARMGCSDQVSCLFVYFFNSAHSLAGWIFIMIFLFLFQGFTQTCKRSLSPP